MSLLTKMQFKLENLFNQLVKMIPSASGKILYNKWVLYFIFVVGIYDIIHFYQRGNTVAVAIFFIVGFLTSFFSKNMIVVIVSAIAVSHIVAYGNKMSEGFEEGIDEEDVDEKEVDEEEVDEKEVDEKEEEKDSDKNPKEKISTSNNEKPESFTELVKDMNNLLEQTEQILSESKQQGFTGMFKNDYTPYQ